MSTYTGVSCHFCAAHRDDRGKLHGHTWTVRAWWNGADDALHLKYRLHIVVASLDHEELPESLSRGEALAAHIGMALGDCVEVEISREPEGIFARWRR